MGAAVARSRGPLHAALDGGATMAQALATARGAMSAEPVDLATAWSFVALGAV